MDHDFMTRYLPPQDAEPERPREHDELIAEPDLSPGPALERDDPAANGRAMPRPGLSSAPATVVTERPAVSAPDSVAPAPETVLSAVHAAPPVGELPTVPPQHPPTRFVEAPTRVIGDARVSGDARDEDARGAAREEADGEADTAVVARPARPAPAVPQEAAAEAAPQLGTANGQGYFTRPSFAPPGQPGARPADRSVAEPRRPATGQWGRGAAPQPQAQPQPQPQPQPRPAPAPQRAAAPDQGVRRGSAEWAQGPAAAGPGAPWAGGPSGHLRADELVKARVVPPEMGWRKVVYVMTGHLVNLGAGPAEQALRDQTAMIGSNIPGNYAIAVLSVKGGVGKTRTTAGIGTVYSTYRTEPVIAMDASPTYGSLGRIVDSNATASIREFMADQHVDTYPLARSYTGKNKQGLEVLPGNRDVANPLALSPDFFVDTLARSQRFYQLSLIDCGSFIDHRVMDAVLGSVDALVIVGTMNFDGVDAAETTINWLAARNMHDLLRRSVLVLNDVNRCENPKFVTRVREALEPRVGALKTVPWDAHLRDGAALDFDALRRRTQLAYIEIAAWLAQGFATTRAVRR